MQFDERTALDTLARLRKVEGQVAGIVRMIEDGRDCAEVIHQISAARRALDRAGLKLLASSLESCLSEQRARGGGDGVPQDFERLFMSLA